MKTSIIKDNDKLNALLLRLLGKRFKITLNLL
jgi:hypothetical protein